MDNNLAVSYTIKLQNSFSKYLTKKNENMNPHKVLYMSLNNNFIRGIQKLETNQMSNHQRIDKCCDISIQLSITEQIILSELLIQSIS